MIRKRLLLPLSVLLLSACAGATETPPPDSVVSSTTTVVFEEPDSDPCAVGSSGDAVECGDENLILEESVEGATERLRNDVVEDSDLQYLLLDEAAYAAVLEPSLGQAELVPGGAMPVYGFYGPALGGRTDLLSWQQEWKLASGPTIVEQVVLFPTNTESQAALTIWKDAAVAAGLSSIDAPSAVSGSFTTAYTDPASIYPDRTCAVQSIVAVSRLLISVTYLTGGDCRVTPSPVPSLVLAGVAARIEAVFPG